MSNIGGASADETAAFLKIASGTLAFMDTMSFAAKQICHPVQTGNASDMHLTKACKLVFSPVEDLRVDLKFLPRFALVNKLHTCNAMNSVLWQVNVARARPTR